MAKRRVVRSNGEVVELVLKKIDRQQGQVTIGILAYNAIFTFELCPKGFAVLVAGGRRAINPGEKILHVSRTVYHQGMKRWATAILTEERGLRNAKADASRDKRADGLLGGKPMWS